MPGVDSSPEMGAGEEPEINASTDIPAVDADSIVPLLTTLGSNAVKSAALLGAIVYAVFRLGYQRYYLSFGLRPEDVGLDHTSVLVHALVGVIVYSAVFGAFVLFVALPIRVLVGLLRDRRHERRNVKLAATGGAPAGELFSPTRAETEWLIAALAPAVWSLYMAVEYASAQGSDSTIYWLVVVAWLAWLFAWWRYRRARHHRTVHYRHALAIAMLVGVFVLLATSDNVGQAAGDYVYNNGRLPDFFQESISTLSVTGECVTIHPVGAFPKDVTLPPAAIYLGQSSGIDILSEPADTPGVSRSIRLSSPTVVLLSAPAESCIPPQGQQQAAGVGLRAHHPRPGKKGAN